MNLPIISLITPSYNQAQYLPQTIRSVLDQNYPQLEYFVMDGGSTDGSRQILTRYTDLLTGWVSQKDRGQADAINQGFALSQGEILGWLNSDDILWPGALQKIGNFFAKHPAVDVVMGWSLYFRENHIWYLHDPVGLRLEYLLYSTYFLPQDAVFWRRRVYEQIGELNLDHYMLDHDYFIRMGKRRSKGAILRHPIGGFRQHDVQKTANTERIQKSQRSIQEYHLADLGITPRQARSRRAYWQTRMLLDRAWRKVRRLTRERAIVKQIIMDSERYLSELRGESQHAHATF